MLRNESNSLPQLFVFQVDTPAAIVNIDAVKRNLTLLRTWRDTSPSSNKVRLRPHYKTHKCPELAELTLRKKPTPDDPDFPGGGAEGICVQTVDELESLVDSIVDGWGTMWTEDNHGVVDVFLTNNVVGEPPARREGEGQFWP